MKHSIFLLIAIAFGISANSQTLSVTNTTTCDLEVVVYYDPGGGCTSKWAVTTCIFANTTTPTPVYTLGTGETYHHVEVYSYGACATNRTCIDSGVIGFQAGIWACTLVYPAATTFQDNCVHCGGGVINLGMAQIASNYQLDITP